MTTNNEFIKQIAETVTDTTISGTHTDNYYWNIIATTVCNKTYTGVTCNGKYIKDIAEAITGTTYNKHHFNNYYYRRIALEYVEELEHTNDNYLLGVIAGNITLGTTVRITSATQSAEYGGSVSVSATVLNSSRQPVSSATVTFKDGDATLGTASTNSDGVATYTDSTLSIGTHSITATYDDVTSNSVSVVITKITPTISLSATDDSVTYGDNITLSGVLSVGSGETISIYDGNTLIDNNVLTTTDGAFSKIITGASTGTHNYTAVYGGDSTYESVTSSSVSVSVAKLDTSLEMSVPPTLVYSDDFNITGTLEDENQNAISSASVGLKVGDTIVDTDTTDSNGECFFTKSPVSMGTHTFQLVYLGDSVYEPSTSSAVTRNITKETSVISVTNPSTSSTTIYSDGTLSISGNLSDDDNTPIANASILVKEGSTTLAILTTDSDGDFTGSVSGSDLSVGSHSIRIDYPENSNYTESYIDKTVVVESPSLSLTSDKSVLSYADRERATLSATYTGASVSGKTVTFKVYDTNDNLLETLVSDDTDNSGVATTSFDSSGYGDVYIKAECSSHIQTYSLQDCLISDSMTSDSGHYTGSPSNKSYSNNGMTINNSNWTAWKYNESLSQGTSIEFDIISLSGSEWNMYMPFYDSSNTEVGAFNVVSNKVNFLSTTENVTSAVGSWRLEIKDGSLKAYLNNVLTLTTAFTTSPFTIGWLTGGSRSFTIKNLKIKPLYDIDLSVTKDILSYVDEESSVITAIVNHPSAVGKAITFTARDNYDNIVDTYSDYVDNNYECEYEYESQGVGDVTVTVECLNLIQTFVVHDCIDTILGESDQTSKFGSSIGLRNNGTSSISYDSTNKQYIVNVTKTNSESFIPINSADGLDDIVIEFDTQIPSYPVINALCFYKETNNWGRLGTKKASSTSTAYEYGGNTNGTYAETDITGSTPPSNTWLHHKFTITNDTIHRQVYNGETLIYEDTRTYTGFFTSTTKYGFTALWSTGWNGYYKNIKIKPL